MKDHPPNEQSGWAEFLATARVGGALPVMFRPDGDHVVVEVIAPYVPPDPGLFVNPNKIPLAIAEGFPVPISARFRLPNYLPVEAPDDAAQFIRDLVRQIYQHEIDEQLFVGDRRPFAPKHEE